MARLAHSALLLGLLLLTLPGLSPWADEGYAAGGTQHCLTCHDYSDQSPVHPLLETVHGKKDKTGSPMAERGCESCHGPSANHADAPTQVAPGISFGPRWNSGIDKQDTQCLSCHHDTIGKSWEHGIHGDENLTCVTCHDAHTRQDKVLGNQSQAEVCTICHKPQKSGVHAMQGKVAENPPCSSCHEPHGNPSAKLLMLNNHSAGCASCHDLVAMSKDPAISPKATSYHKVMAQPGRTCLDCHKGIAHAPADSVAPFVAQAVSKKTITMFSPGQADAEWLLSEHPGSQSLRQGRDCEQCHQGEEANMGKVLATEGTQATRDISVSFKSQGNNLAMTLSWSGSAEDKQVAIMWGDDGNEAFRRGGCWAACHSDLPGMSRDRGQDLSKYLAVSRSQQQQIGKPPRNQSQAELDKLMTAGNFVELWQLDLSADGVSDIRSATILDGTHWSKRNGLRGTTHFNNGRWTASFVRPLAGGADEKAFIPGKQYTFGIALQGAGQSAAGHWVSLPLTFSLDDRDSDFISAK